MVDTGIFSYAIYRPDYITITGTPDVEARKYPLRLLAALTLGGKCIEKDCGDWPVPDWAWDHYFRAWYDGVLYTLYGMPNKPWSNAQLATTHARRYRNREAFHKQEALEVFRLILQHGGSRREAGEMLHHPFPKQVLSNFTDSSITDAVVMGDAVTCCALLRRIAFTFWGSELRSVVVESITAFCP